MSGAHTTVQHTRQIILKYKDIINETVRTYTKTNEERIYS
jgi:hypothetical protein